MDESILHKIISDLDGVLPFGLMSLLDIQFVRISIQKCFDSLAALSPIHEDPISEELLESIRERESFEKSLKRAMEHILIHNPKHIIKKYPLYQYPVFYKNEQKRSRRLPYQMHIPSRG
jgi:hypothetical protein